VPKASDDSIFADRPGTAGRLRLEQRQGDCTVEAKGGGEVEGG